MESLFHLCLNTQVKIFFLSKERILKDNNPQYDVSNFYMIGDNPAVDIKGGNDNGFKTILVRTGVFESREANCTNYPATYCVNDFRDAINLILKNERL